ncbi:YqgE/AlgH family protein [Alteromonas antoniana]|uniref:YqgE/AlgH family protein n=1 Tax=Alteromonas antoniana TaxID=2803813 RepID=UPI001C43D2A7|nr:YqgE/AlgH family protein [Alteromonas antoniana]
MTELKSLQNHFLIATPSLDDAYFSRSLTYICEHNAEGAMGLVINQPSTMTLKQLLEQTDKDITVADENAEKIILAGGPVSQERGFVLHTDQSGWSSSLALAPGIMVTTSKDILSAIGTQQGPDESIIALGYAGWTAGQLEKEMQENAWLTIEADEEILFKTPIHEKWQAAVNKLGIDVWQLAPGVGHA